MSWKPILAVLARLAALAIVVQAGTIWVCSSWFWTPMQRHYLPAYFWSSLPVVAPSTVEVRLIWKTGPHRKPELASADDAVSSDDGTGMALSPWARDTGWMGLIEGPPEQVPTAKLGPGLADLAFDGESLGDFFLLPEAFGAAVFLLTLFGWFCLKGWCQLLISELAWQRRIFTWATLRPMLFEECVALAQSASSGVGALHRSVVRRIETRPAVTSTYAAVAEPTLKPVAFAFPLFGVHNHTGEGSYLWQERNEIE
jgi:hypothetical protein